MAQPSLPSRGLGPTLVCAGRWTLAASTRIRTSVVRPETAAAHSRAVKTRSFRVCPMVGRSSPTGVAALGTRPRRRSRATALPGAQRTHLRSAFRERDAKRTGCPCAPSVRGAWGAGYRDAPCGDALACGAQHPGGRESPFLPSPGTSGAPRFSAQPPGPLLPSRPQQETQLRTELGGPGPTSPTYLVLSAAPTRPPPGPFALFEPEVGPEAGGCPCLCCQVLGEVRGPSHASSLLKDLKAEAFWTETVASVAKPNLGLL